jgi:hypothetical protein
MFAKHRVFVPTNISMEGGVFVSQIRKGARTTLGTKMAGTARVRVNRRSALGARCDYSGSLSFSWHRSILACGRR